MRLGAFVPALVLGAALVAPPAAQADPQGPRDRGGRPGYDRSGRGHRGDQRGRSYRSYDRGRRHLPPPRHHYRPSHRRHYRAPRPYYHRPYYGPRYGPYNGYRPYPRRYWAPYPAPYVTNPGPYDYPRYNGVHGSVAIGLPFFGFSLHF